MLPYLLVGLLAGLYVVVQYCMRMGGQGHYQFFPIAIVGAFALYLSRRPNLPRRDDLSSNSRIMFVIAWLLMLFSLFVVSLLNSSFLGWLNLLIFLASVIWFCQGLAALKALCAPMILLLFLTPMPSQLDQALVFQMQRFASYLASNVLDFLGIFHNLQGVVISVIDMRFLAEEACSGIRSLFSSICGIFFVGAYLQYSWWRHFINISQTVVWVLIGNAIRIAVVVVAFVWFDVDLATGIVHSGLGIVTFFMIVGLAFSTDRLLNGIVNGKGVRKQNDFATATSSNHFKPTLGVWKYPLLAASVLMTLVSIRLLSLTDNGFANITTGYLEKPVESDLPVSLLGWSRSSFHMVSRDADDVQGEHSSIWTYSKDNQSIQISADSDWDDFHDLTYCYSGLGWNCDTQHQYSPLSEIQEDKENGYSVITLSKLTGEKSLVIFSVIDRDGSIVRPPVKLGRDTSIYIRELLVNRLRALIFLPSTDSIRKSTFEAPVMTFQVLVPANVTLTDDVITQLQTFYVEARKSILKSSRFQF